MGPLKAPGEDGYPALFFHQNWDIVADSLFKYVNQVWINYSFSSSINNTVTSTADESRGVIAGVQGTAMSGSRQFLQEPNHIGMREILRPCRYGTT